MEWCTVCHSGVMRKPALPTGDAPSPHSCRPHRFVRRHRAVGAGLSGEERRARLAEARLYVCTGLQDFLDDGALDAEAFSAFVTACYSGGVDIIQVRDKSVDAAVELEALHLLVALAAEHRALSAANDRADLAALAGVDVFHTGQSDLNTQQCRALLGPDVLLGRSCRTRAQVDAARAEAGLDYFCTGPVWPTPTKPGRAAVGLELPAYAAWRAREDGNARPFFAIGGIDVDRLPTVLETGAERVAVVRAVTDAEEPDEAAARLRDLLPR